MDSKKKFRLVGIVGLVLQGLGLLLPFLSADYALAQESFSFFEMEPEWFEILWIVAGIIVLLIGTLTTSRGIVAVGGVVSLGFIVYLLISLNVLKNSYYLAPDITPSIGLYMYLCGGIAGLIAAFLMGQRNDGTVSS